MRYREIITERGENLAAWFAGSKVVDEHGKPKRMYHGSKAAFTSFDPSKANADALAGPGFYFTDSPDVAGGTGGSTDEREIEYKAHFNQAGYAFQGSKYELPPLTKKQMNHFMRILNSKEVEKEWYEDVGLRRMWQAGHAAYEAGPEASAKWIANDGPRWLFKRMKVDPVRTTTPTVYPVYLSIKNPFDMDTLLDPEQAQALRKKMWDASTPLIGGEHHETFENATAGYRGTRREVTAGYVWEWMAYRIFSNNKKKATETLIAMGYDGIHHTGGQVVGTMGKHDVWIAFYPSQIKSIFASKYDTDSTDIGESI